MYDTCFCAPIIKAPIYYQDYNTGAVAITGETANLPVITNQVKNDIQSPKGQMQKHNIQNITVSKISIITPIGLWLKLNDDYDNKANMWNTIHTFVGGGSFNGNFYSNGQYSYPSFYFEVDPNDINNVDVKLDIGYYKDAIVNKDINKYPYQYIANLQNIQFSLIIKLEKGLINIYLNDNKEPTISINKDQCGIGWQRSPDYKTLNAGYAFSPDTDGTLKLEMVLALPNKSFSSSLNSYYIPTKPVTSIKRNIESIEKRQKMKTQIEINKKVKNIGNTSIPPGLYLYQPYGTYILLDPSKYPIQ